MITSAPIVGETPAFVQFNDDKHYGFVLITLDNASDGSDRATFEYWTITDTASDGKPYVLRDSYTLTK